MNWLERAAGLFAAYFYSPDQDWTFSGMALASGTNGDAPFFMQPSISLRGVPYNRYQGDRVFSTEVEVRRQLSSRWAIVGFGGYGYPLMTKKTSTPVKPPVKREGKA